MSSYGTSWNWSSAIMIANDLLHKNPSMVINQEFLEEGRIPYLSIDLFSEVVKNTLQSVYNYEEFLIELFDEKGPATGLCAHLLRHSKPDSKIQHFTIIRDGKMNNCWKRFARAKELAHIYMINVHDVTLGTDVVHELKGAWISLDDFFNKEDLTVEAFATAIAIELMIPYSIRHVMKTLYEHYNNNKLTMYDIARSVYVPELILEQYYHKGIYEYSTKLYDELPISTKCQAIPYPKHAVLIPASIPPPLH